MEAFNVNQSWKAPEGYALQGVYAEGAFLRHEYLSLTKPKTLNVFVNDMGREVTRTVVLHPTAALFKHLALPRKERIQAALRAIRVSFGILIKEVLCLK